MILRKKMRKQTKIFKKAINAKWAFYWAKFMTEAATICRKYTHEVIGHIVRTIIHEMAGGKK